MVALEWGFNRWVGAWCLSVAGLGLRFLWLWLSVRRGPFSFVVRKNVTRAELNQEVISEWKLGSTRYNVKSETVHLKGRIRSEKLENNINYF